MKTVKITRESNRTNVLALRDKQTGRWIVSTAYGEGSALGHKTEMEAVAYLSRQADELGLVIVTR